MLVTQPTDSRYTLQWIITPRNQFTLDLFPNNNDATFMNQQSPKPADVLLHYNYGAAAVKEWGENTSVLDNRLDIRSTESRTRSQFTLIRLITRKCSLRCFCMYPLSTSSTHYWKRDR